MNFFFFLTPERFYIVHKRHVNIIKSGQSILPSLMPHGGVFDYCWICQCGIYVLFCLKVSLSTRAGPK